MTGKGNDLLNFNFLAFFGVSKYFDYQLDLLKMYQLAVFILNVFLTHQDVPFCQQNGGRIKDMIGSTWDISPRFGLTKTWEPVPKVKLSKVKLKSKELRE